jgi:hypothetical protein
MGFHHGLGPQSGILGLSLYLLNSCGGAYFGWKPFWDLNPECKWGVKKMLIGVDVCSVTATTDMTNLHLFYQVVKLRSQLPIVIQLYTVPFMYFTPPTWRWPFKVKTYCQIKGYNIYKLCWWQFFPLSLYCFIFCEKKLPQQKQNNFSNVYCHM